MNADEAVRALAAAIAAEAARDPRPFAVMHVCGTHEHTIARAGLRALLPRNVELLAGPGCPVCVTPQEEIARAAAIARAADATLATYGDMVRVPAFGTSLAEERAKGLDLKVVQGPAEAAGLKVGDIVLKVDGHPTPTLNQIKMFMHTHEPGDTVKFLVLRDGKETAIEVKAGETPKE